jgi:hypothetical protein
LQQARALYPNIADHDGRRKKKTEGMPLRAILNPSLWKTE